MTKLQYYSHLLLNSKYKFLLTLFLYSLIIILYNSNHEIYCIEEKKENIILSDSSDEYNLTEKLIGYSMFVTSIFFMLFLQSITSTLDPDSIVEATSHIINSPVVNDISSPVISEASSSIISDINVPVITELPSCLDDFQINDIGDVIINGIRVDLDNIYLNASKVEEEIINNILKNQVADYKAFHLVTALSRAEALDPVYLSLYEDFLEKGNRPEEFYNYLAKALNLNR